MILYFKTSSPFLTITDGNFSIAFFNGFNNNINNIKDYNDCFNNYFFTIPFSIPNLLAS